MKKKILTLATEDDLLINLTFHKLSASLIAEFADKIVRPHYRDNLNDAIQDLIHKALEEQDFVHSHITHIRRIIPHGSGIRNPKMEKLQKSPEKRRRRGSLRRTHRHMQKPRIGSQQRHKPNYPRTHDNVYSAGSTEKATETRISAERCNLAKNLRLPSSRH